jgi:hypothetical protein
MSLELIMTVAVVPLFMDVKTPAEPGTIRYSIRICSYSHCSSLVQAIENSLVISFNPINMTTRDDRLTWNKRIDASEGLFISDDTGSRQRRMIKTNMEEPQTVPSETRMKKKSTKTRSNSQRRKIDGKKIQQESPTRSSDLPSVEQRIGGKIETENKKVERNKQELSKLVEDFQTENCDLKEKLEKMKVRQRKDRRAIRDLEESNVDINFDLAEAKKVIERLEKENAMLRRKAIYAEEENERLQNQVANLMGFHNVDGMIETDVDGIESDTHDMSSKFSPHHRRSVWRTLKEEAVPGGSKITISQKPESSTTSILDKFFGNSSASLLTSTDNSVITGTSSQNTDPKLPQNLTDIYGSSHSAKTVPR